MLLKPEAGQLPHQVGSLGNLLRRDFAGVTVFKLLSLHRPFSHQQLPEEKGWGRRQGLPLFGPSA
jgi:hypothetical protein